MRVPKVSVILPTWNGSETLRQAAGSILEQTFTDFELIIADDGSTDQTPEIVRQLAASDPRVVPLLRSHAGLAATPNAAIAVAKGTFLAMMDHDDISLPHRLELQVAFLEKHPEIVAVGGSYIEFFPAGGQEIKRSGRSSYPFDMTSFPPVCSHPMHPTVMIQTEAMKKIGGYRNAFSHIGQDVDMFVRLRAEGGFADIPDVVLRYRRHAKNTSFTRREAGRVHVTLCYLSGIARHFSHSDAEAVALIAAGRTDEAIHAYKALLGNQYPVQALVDYFDIAGSVGVASTLRGAWDMTARNIASPIKPGVKWAIADRFARRVRGYVSAMARRPVKFAALTSPTDNRPKS